MSNGHDLRDVLATLRFADLSRQLRLQPDDNNRGRHA